MGLTKAVILYLKAVGIELACPRKVLDVEDPTETSTTRIIWT